MHSITARIILPQNSAIKTKTPKKQTKKTKQKKPPIPPREGLILLYMSQSPK